MPTLMVLSRMDGDWSDMDVQELLGKVAQHLSVSRAFGTAYEKDGSLVIPVALVAGGGGGGSTGSPPTDLIDDEGIAGEGNAPDNDSSSGSGGGLGGLVMPVGVYVVKDERVRWVPAVNANLMIVITFMIIRVIARARRKSRRHAS